MTIGLLRAACCVLALGAALSPAGAQSADDAAAFFKGKTIRLDIATGPGGAYGAYGLVFAQYFGKHVPGNPTVVPQNMPGAGSLKAANFIYSAAPKDGLAFGTFARTTGINPLLESGATWTGGPTGASVPFE